MAPPLKLELSPPGGGITLAVAEGLAEDDVGTTVGLGIGLIVVGTIALVVEVVVGGEGEGEVVVGGGRLVAGGAAVVVGSTGAELGADVASAIAMLVCEGSAAEA